MLSLKQKKFCEEYVISGNATEAAKRAGYSENSAKVTASRMLTNANIQNYIKELTNPVKSARIATGEEVLAFFTEVMKNKKVGWKDRIRAAENLAKRQGVDKPVNTTNGEEKQPEGVTINIKDCSKDDT